tara:strand:+ start:786 stop:1292 length:507 start_codon:yes stop_codon:yes gene_type:complete
VTSVKKQSLSVVKIRANDVPDILSWRYTPPYDFYDPPPHPDVATYTREFLKPELAFHVVLSEEALIGFCSYGIDGQVPGGDYTQGALDIGLGMRPELTGQGQGSAFFSAVLTHGTTVWSPSQIRLTVASFNRRARRLYEQFGFCYHSEFNDPQTNVHYVILMSSGSRW